MRSRALRITTTTASFVAIVAATASSQSILRTHDGQASGNIGFGRAADFVGDVDGDGVSDYAVGAPYASGGEAYVYSGRTGALLWTLVAEGDGHEFGSDVAPVGDIDGDGRADFLVVAPMAPQVQYLANDGWVYLVSGATGAVLRKIEGTNEEGIYHACGIGDVDGDLVPDVAAVSLMFGNVRGYSGASGALLWTLHQPTGAYFTGPLAALGDVNGDGVPDLCAAGANSFPAFVGIYSGVDGALIRRINLQVDASDVATVPDVDGDGVRDLAIGAPERSSSTGAVDVYSGASGTLLYTLNGAVPGAYFGSRVVDAGDINGDGVHEIAVTSIPVATRWNSIAQFFRSDTGTLIAALPSEHYLGADLAGGYDLDGDGRSELLITDTNDSDHSTWYGRAYVYRGDDLYLFANQAWYASGEPLVLDSRPGIPAQVASIWVLAVDGSPFPLRAAGGTYDGNGSFSISATVPPGLAGIDIDLIAFGIDGSGRLRRSVVTNVEFR